MLPIVLDKNRAPHLPHFLQFLEMTEHQRITLDQWDSFLQFNAAVQEDLKNLEDDGACKHTFSILLHMAIILCILNIV